MQPAEPLYPESVKSVLGDPIKDRAVYEKCSPITYLTNAKAPLLIVQGENDPRVLTEEAEQAVAILKQNGRVVEAHRYRDMGHGFNNSENAIDALKRSIEWFDRYLKNGH